MREHNYCTLHGVDITIYRGSGTQRKVRHCQHMTVSCLPSTTLSILLLRDVSCIPKFATRRRFWVSRVVGCLAPTRLPHGRCRRFGISGFISVAHIIKYTSLWHQGIIVWHIHAGILPMRRQAGFTRTAICNCHLGTSPTTTHITTLRFYTYIHIHPLI